MTTAQPLMIAVEGGFKVACPADLDCLSTFVFLEQEDWFEDEARFIRRVAAPGVRMIDIGANLGFYTLATAAAAGGDAYIVAIEPTPDVAALLRLSVQANGFAGVRVLELAVGDRNMRVALDRPMGSEHNSIGAEVGSGGVALRRLDDLVEELDMRSCDIVKIDVEGAEARVIDGASVFFETADPLIMFEVRDRTGISFEAAERLKALGYAIYELAPELEMLTPFSGHVDDMRLNLFACKPSRAALLESRGLLARTWDVGPTTGDGQAMPVSGRTPMVGPGGELHEMALGWFATSRSVSQRPSVRAGALRLAQAAALAALRADSRIAHLCTYARISRALGARAEATKAAKAVLEAILAGERSPDHGPMLAMLAEYETWSCPLGPDAWLEAMAIESVWRWGAYSDLFTSDYTLSPGRAAQLQAVGRQSKELERRRLLSLRRQGRSLPSSLLPPSDRNSELWHHQLFSALSG